MSFERRDGSGIQRAVVGAIGAALLIASLPASAQMDIESISITSGPAYASGVFTDFFFDPELEGTGIASVRLTRQNGAFVDLVEDPPGIWACDEVIPSGPCENFPSLDAVRALGNLTFTVTGSLGESDTVLILLADWDPGTGQTGIPTITSPTPGETGVSLTPTFTWSAAPAWVGAILANVQEAATGEDVDEALLFPPATSWQPTRLLSPGANLDFRLSFFDVFFFEDPRSSTQTDDFLFTSAFEIFNFVPFSTVIPVPGLGLLGGSLLAVGLVASGRAALRRRARG